LSLETLVNLEDAVAEVLGEAVDVDGHEIGSDEANIFLWAHDPIGTIAKLLPLLEQGGPLADARVAYRATGEDTYRVLWPRDSSEPFKVT
jgi:hypothetical protein